MKKKWLLIFILVLAGLPVGPSLRAQQARLASTPPLGEAFPLVATPDGVHLKYPVLLNAHTVLETNAVLRLVYIDPNAGLHLKSADDQGVQSGFLPHHHSGGFDAASESAGKTPLSFAKLSMPPPISARRSSTRFPENRNSSPPISTCPMACFYPRSEIKSRSWL
jgi:hypothetical protein